MSFNSYSISDFWKQTWNIEEKITIRKYPLDVRKKKNDKILYRQNNHIQKKSELQHAVYRVRSGYNVAYCSVFSVKYE